MSRLELRDISGKLLSTVDGVKHFFVNKQGVVFAVVEIENAGEEVYRISGKSVEKIYTTPHKISFLQVDGKGIMISQKSSKEGYSKIVYMDLDTKSIYSLPAVVPLDFISGFGGVIREGETYFMSLLGDKPTEDNSIVDIWYGSDNQLDEKFLPPPTTNSYVWEPLK